jgi:hypothetical protein
MRRIKKVGKVVIAVSPKFYSLMEKHRMESYAKLSNKPASMPQYTDLLASNIKFPSLFNNELRRQKRRRI